MATSMEKIDARKLSTEAQQQIRNQAIRLRKSGRTYKDISEITGFIMLPSEL